MPELSPGLLRNIYIVVIVQLENDSINIIVSGSTVLGKDEVNNCIHKISAAGKKTNISPIK